MIQRRRSPRRIGWGFCGIWGFWGNSYYTANKSMFLSFQSIRWFFRRQSNQWTKSNCCKKHVKGKVWCCFHFQWKLPPTITLLLGFHASTTPLGFLCKLTRQEARLCCTWTATNASNAPILILIATLEKHLRLYLHQSRRPLMGLTRSRRNPPLRYRVSKLPRTPGWRQECLSGVLLLPVFRYSI